MNTLHSDSAKSNTHEVSKNTALYVVVILGLFAALAAVTYVNRSPALDRRASTNIESRDREHFGRIKADWLAQVQTGSAQATNPELKYLQSTNNAGVSSSDVYINPELKYLQSTNVAGAVSSDLYANPELRYLSAASPVGEAALDLHVNPELKYLGQP